MKHDLENAKAGEKVRVEIEANKSSKAIDPYACAINIKHRHFDTWLTVGIFRERFTSLYLLYQRRWNDRWEVVSTDYKVYDIPSGGLEIPLLLTSNAERERIHK